MRVGIAVSWQGRILFCRCAATRGIPDRVNHVKNELLNIDSGGMPFEVHFIPAGLSIRSGMEEHMVIPARILPLISSFVSAREKINHRHQASLMMQ